MKRIMYAFALLLGTSVTAQTFTEKLIYQDNADSLYLKCNSKSFDKAGDYFFEIQDGDTAYSVTKEARYDIKYTSTAFSSNGTMSSTASYPDPPGTPWYYRNAHGIKVLGPVRGELKHYVSNNSGGNIALTLTWKDSVFFYLDGRLIAQNKESDLKGFNLELEAWCAFSDKGNAIYFIKEGPWYKLYVNGVFKDKSKEYYREMYINDEGEYTYGEGRRPDAQIKGYDEYMFFIHARDTALGPVRTVWNNALAEHGGYYYSGDDNGPEYIAVNGSMHKGINDVTNIIVPDKRHYMYTFGDENNRKVNASGKIYSNDFERISCPAMDTQGNFAFYGMKDYYLYKFVNGKQQAEALSRYNVRAEPVYISPSGKSLHYFETDDSLYLYQDDSLLFPPIAATANFKAGPADDDMYYYFEKKKYKEADALLYLEYGAKAYFVYSGVFSRPMLPVLDTDMKRTFGHLVAGTHNRHGFFVIQKTGDAKFMVNINNKVYHELDGVQAIFKDNCFLMKGS